MVKLKELSFELKIGLFFGVVALVLSFLTGIFAGVGFFVTVMRSLVMIPVFIILGYGAMIVIKNRVPELYEVLTAEKNIHDANIVESDEATKEEENFDILDDSNLEASSFKQNEGFTEFKNDDYDKLFSVDDSGLEVGPDTNSGKLGKHIIVEDQFDSYEPELLAEAVRTMMSKDKD